MNSLHECKFDTKDATPLYLQVAGHLTVKIHSGMWKPNEALPSERDLSEIFEISRVTTRKAIDVLCRRDLLSRRQGSGTYVSSNLAHPLSRLTNFSEDLRQRGHTPGSQWISRETGFAVREEIRALGLAPKTRVSRLKRLRTADNVVVAIEISTIPAKYVPDPNAVTDTLYGFLSQHGVLPARARQHISAINASTEQARLTNIEPGAAMLHIKRLGYLESGAAIELTHSYFPSDSYDFVAVLCPQLQMLDTDAA